MNKDYQGALSRLRSDLNFNKWFGFNEEDYEMIEELVQKATPKKANIMGEFVGECPNCHKILLGAVADYCYHCGQALSWGEENELAN